MGWCAVLRNVKYEELVDIDKMIAMYKIIRANTKNRGKLHKFELFYLIGKYTKNVYF